MNTLLKNILFQSKNNTQVVLSTIGALIGMLALLLVYYRLTILKRFKIQMTIY